jgi:UDPglucose 6-dehydrogenase
MQITVIGTGFVGVVSAAVYASFGHRVYGLDVNERKVAALRQGEVPFFEPDLRELLQQQQSQGNLTFTTNYAEAVQGADVVIIAVGTPSAPDGQADLRFVFMSAESMSPHLKNDVIVAIKSTVPPGTNQQLEAKIKELRPDLAFATASLPEFLREGSAVHDTLHPDRVVIGCRVQRVFKTLSTLHEPLQAPIIHVTPESAQMAKYSANSFLATRITFINQIADLCEKNGADIQDVIQAIGFDKRIGTHYWYPGLGYGGSCFPKDVKELAAYSRSVGEENNLLNKVNELNEQRMWRLLERFEKAVFGWEGKTVAVLGLSFKPNTDDIREAPSTKIIPYLLNKNARVIGFDPKVTWPAQLGGPGFQQTSSIDKAVDRADVIMVLVEWPQIVQFNFGQNFGDSSNRNASQRKWFIDARNQFEPAKIEANGYNYLGIGR